MVEYERITHYDAKGTVTGFSEVERVTSAEPVFIKRRAAGGPTPTMFTWCEDGYAINCHASESWPTEASPRPSGSTTK